MKFEYSVVKFDVKDVVTTSTPSGGSGCPGGLVIPGQDLSAGI